MDKAMVRRRRRVHIGCIRSSLQQTSSSSPATTKHECRRAYVFSSRLRSFKNRQPVPSAIMVAAGLDEAPPRCALRACECRGARRCEARDRAMAGLMDRHRALLLSNLLGAVSFSHYLGTQMPRRLSCSRKRFN